MKNPFVAAQMLLRCLSADEQKISEALKRPNTPEWCFKLVLALNSTDQFVQTDGFPEAVLLQFMADPHRHAGKSEVASTTQFESVRRVALFSSHSSALMKAASENPHLTRAEAFGFLTHATSGNIFSKMFESHCLPAAVAIANILARNDFFTPEETQHFFQEFVKVVKSNHSRLSEAICSTDPLRSSLLLNENISATSLIEFFNNSAHGKKGGPEYFQVGRHATTDSWRPVVDRFMSEQGVDTIGIPDMYVIDLYLQVVKERTVG